MSDRTSNKTPQDKSYLWKNQMTRSKNLHQCRPVSRNEIPNGKIESALLKFGGDEAIHFRSKNNL